MPIEREFLGWNRPPLALAVDCLRRAHARQGHWDMRALLLAAPNQRARRLLQEQLVDQAELHALRLEPPDIATLAELPERLYEPKRPFASPFVQHLAWSQALRGLDRAALQEFIARPPADNDALRWLALAQTMSRRHVELADEGLNFESVAQRLDELNAPPRERRRWRLFSQAQREYLRILDAELLWDLPTARLEAVRLRECRAPRRLVLVGAVQMTATLRKMLEQAAGEVSSLVFAPGEQRRLFDEWGCVDVGAWQNEPLPLAESHWRLAPGPREQVDETARVLAANAARRPDEIVIGLPDLTLAPLLERRLARRGVVCRGPVGKRLEETAPCQLLAAIAAYQQNGRTAQFAALARRPEVFDWLSARVPGDWLTQLDKYYNAHLQPRLGEWLGAEDSHALVRAAHDHLQALLRPLSGSRRSLSQWSALILRVLAALYAERTFQPDAAGDHYTLAACQQLRELLLELESLPDRLSPTLSAGEAIPLVLEQAHGQKLPPPHAPDAVEWVGWLDLPWDGAPVVVLTTFNEGYVPRGGDSELALPDSLRRGLGLDDNNRRLARDACALRMLLESRESLTLLAAQRNAAGDPLAPSRLLFATDPVTIARRAARCFGSTAAPPSAAAPLAAAPARTAPARTAPAPRGFVVRKPAPCPPVEVMTVTSFRAYLACPYRYYLRHVLKLEPLGDVAEELDAAGFGNLTHDVLEDFGRAQRAAPLTSEDDIRDYLYAALERHEQALFGEHRQAAVRLQLLQARSRLEAFARWQAEWAGQGWRIRFIEEPSKERTATLDLGGGQTMRLKGRIDRVDQNENTGEWVVFDYKTSEAGKSPRQTHFSGGAWTDLQLPLYRPLARLLGVSHAPRLGYILLAKDTQKIGAQFADWTLEELESADQTALEVARRVRAGVFWPPRYPPPRVLDEFAGLCQDDVFDRRLES